MGCHLKMPLPVVQREGVWVGFITVNLPRGSSLGHLLEASRAASEGHVHDEERAHTTRRCRISRDIVDNGLLCVGRRRFIIGHFYICGQLCFGIRSIFKDNEGRVMHPK